MSVLTDPDIDDLVRLAGRLADATGQAAIPHFRASALVTDNKEGGAGFDPVTIADRAAEQAVRDILAIERPEDGIFGEEQERTEGTSGLTWVLDPIDGTRAFISGLPVWGTLIGLDDGHLGRIGVMDQPFTGERYVGVLRDRGPEAWLEHKGMQRPLKTRKGVTLAEAVLYTTSPDIFADEETPVFHRIRSKARMTRYGTDCYAYCLVALGCVDLVIESGLNAYDIAALIPIIQAAGGVVTDWKGGDCRWGGQVVAAGSAELHAEALEMLAVAAR